MTKIVLVCGPWGSGTTAVAGALERMGAPGLSPYFETYDPNTPNSYESIAFRDEVLRYADEESVSLRQCISDGVEFGLQRLQAEIEGQQTNGHDGATQARMFFKYPLSALLIPAICSVFDTKLVYVMRPLENIEQTRLRRNWPAHFGSAGGAIIYRHMAVALESQRCPVMTIDYPNLLISTDEQLRRLAQFADLEPEAAQLARALEFLSRNRSSSASLHSDKPKLSLCMIVKNEASVIRRCLDSVRPVIDYWTIVDTGSTDGTQDIIREHMKDIPGELFERPWQDFAHNRTEALELARPNTEYSLIIDADDMLEIPDQFLLPDLSCDSYTVDIIDSGVHYRRTQLVRNLLPWRYEGLLHEFPSCDEAKTIDHLPVRIRRNHDGARQRNADTYARDAELLERALLTERRPDIVARYTFYLAQSYRDAGQPDKALLAYLERTRLGYWDEEIFESLYNAGRLQESLGYPFEEVMATYKRATEAVPSRAEALHASARFCRINKRFDDAYAAASRGLKIQLPPNGLFLQPWIYEYGLLDEFAVAAYWVGRFCESLNACRALLNQRTIPEHERERIESNANFAKAKLTPPTARAGDKLPRVCIFGRTVQLFSTPDVPEVETSDLDCRCFESDQELERILIDCCPHVIVSFGEIRRFPRLLAAPFEVRRRWLHYDDGSDLVTVGREVFQCYLSVCIDHRGEEPLVSVFTPTYRTGERFLRPLRSLQAQSYVNWEWVIWDDSDDGGETARMIEPHAGRDHRIRLIRPARHSGIIGDVKFSACALSCGEILVELDHDDELTPGALGWIVAAHKKYPDAGFYYSDFAEVDAQLNPLCYPDGWGFGFGSYRTENYRGRELLVANAPGISPKVIRHLVAAPNHVRAWRRDLYFRIGGHNRHLHVADDFELILRTFLETRMVHIPRLGYLQYQDGGNTQRVRNKDIQRHVRFLRWKYDRRIHERFVQLGVDDYMWNEEGGFADFGCANPPVVQVASITAKL